MISNNNFYNRTVENKNIIYLISHERSKTGAPIVLENLNIYLQKNGLKTELLYFTENKNIYDYIVSKTIDATIILNTVTLYDLVYRFSRVGRFKLFWYVHEWIDETNSSQIKKNLRNGNIFNNANIRMLFPCAMCETNYRNIFAKIQKSSILTNSYNLDSLEAHRTKPLELNKEGNIVIGIVGIICSRKNQKAFIDDVFYRLLDEYPYCSLLLVGAEASPLNLNPLYKHSIVKVGVVDNALPYINYCDICVSYSLNEVLPLNIIESAFCGKPIVSSDVGGVREIIEDGKTGFLFKSGDYDKCYELLSRLIDNKELRYSIGSEAKKAFSNKFNEEINFKPLLSLLK